MRIPLPQVLSYNTAKQILYWPFQSKKNFFSAAIPTTTFVAANIFTNLSYTSSLVISGAFLALYKYKTYTKTKTDKKSDEIKAPDNTDETNNKQQLPTNLLSQIRKARKKNLENPANESSSDVNSSPQVNRATPSSKANTAQNKRSQVKRQLSPKSSTVNCKKEATGASSFHYDQSPEVPTPLKTPNRSTKQQPPLINAATSPMHQDSSSQQTIHFAYLTSLLYLDSPPDEEHAFFSKTNIVKALEFFKVNPKFIIDIWNQSPNEGSTSTTEEKKIRFEYLKYYLNV